MKHLFSGRPIDGLNQESAEAAALLRQSVDACDAIVWRPDDPRPVPSHVVYNPFQRTIKGGLAAIGTLQILPKVAAGAHADFIQGLLPVFG